MEILRTLGDGNCQFRSLAILMTGADHEGNQKNAEVSVGFRMSEYRRERTEEKYFLYSS